MTEQPVHTPFCEPVQQREADLLGMYVFVGTEMMLFGALLALAVAYRSAHPDYSIEASEHLKLWLATANTAVLLTSSLSVALAVAASRAGSRRPAAIWLGVAALLGLAFLGLKAIEYAADYHEGLMPLVGHPSAIRHTPAALFLDLYFVGTAIHALHLTVGVALLAWLIVRILLRRTELPRQVVTVETVGLFWHFIDVVWIFLFATFYLARH